MAKKRDDKGRTQIKGGPRSPKGRGHSLKELRELDRTPEPDELIRIAAESIARVIERAAKMLLAKAEQFIARDKLIIRAWLVFALMIGLFVTGLLFLNLYTRFDEWANTATATMLAVALWLLGAGGQATGTLVSSKIFSAEIITECTAVFPIMIFLAAVIAYPCAWNKKLLGMMLGVPAILFVNMIRLVSLFYIGYWFPNAFETAHLLVWQSLIIFLAVLLWLVWAELFVHRHEIQGA